MHVKNKGWNEGFAKFFEAPSREGLRNLLRDHLGESDGYDFKEVWPAYSKLSRHILGLANYGGGCLIIGVKEKNDKTFDPVGLEQFKDKAALQKAIEKFIPGQLDYSILDFSYKESEYPKIKGKIFQVLIVEDTPKYIPFVAKADGDGIRKNGIYFRHFTSSEEANYEELQTLFNRRIETEYSTRDEFNLQNHLDELKALYRFINPIIKYYHYEDPEDEYQEYQNFSIGANPNYPIESFEKFVKKLIEGKKKFIRNMLIRK